MAEKNTPGTSPTKRILLMDFEVQTNHLPPTVVQKLEEQMGEGKVPETIRIHVPVGEGHGGPKQIIDRQAKVGDQPFRAIAEESYEQGFVTIPPDQEKFDLKPL